MNTQKTKVGVDIKLIGPCDGPWNYVLNRGKIIIRTEVAKNTRDYIAEIVYGPTEAFCWAEARARLISAAPELLDALKSAKRVLVETADEESPLIKKIESAIRKAEETGIYPNAKHVDGKTE